MGMRIEQEIVTAQWTLRASSGVDQRAILERVWAEKNRGKGVEKVRPHPISQTRSRGGFVTARQCELEDRLLDRKVRQLVAKFAK